MQPSSTPRAPLPPYLVLAAAALLPGVGQLLNGQVTRALTFIFFILLFGALTYQLTTPAHSFVGRHAGGFFVYAIAVLDAYRFARLRSGLFKKGGMSSETTAEHSRLPTVP